MAGTNWTRLWAWRMTDKFAFTFKPSRAAEVRLVGVQLSRYCASSPRLILFWLSINEICYNLPNCKQCQKAAVHVKWHNTFDCFNWPVYCVSVHINICTELNIRREPCHSYYRNRMRYRGNITSSSPSIVTRAKHELQYSGNERVMFPRYRVLLW